MRFTPDKRAAFAERLIARAYHAESSTSLTRKRNGYGDWELIEWSAADGRVKATHHFPSKAALMEYVKAEFPTRHRLESRA